MSDKQRPSESSGDAEKTKATPIRFFLSSSDVADKEKLTELFRKLLPPREKPR